MPAPTPVKPYWQVNNSDHLASATEAANRSEFLGGRHSLHTSAHSRKKRRPPNVQACYSLTHTRAHTRGTDDIFRKSFHAAVCSYGKRPHGNRSRTSRNNPHNP